MKIAFFIGAACVLSLMGLIVQTWTTTQEPLQRARAQALRIAQEQGIAVEQLTRFAGERVVWTARGTPMGDTPVGDTPVGDTPVGDTPVGDTPVLLMISDDQVTRLLEQQTISEADMRGRIAQAYPGAHIVRLVRGVFQEQWVWEAWIRYDGRDAYVYASLMDGRWIQTLVVGVHK